MNNIQTSIQRLTADPEIIKGNFVRIWGTIHDAIRKTGLSKQCIYNSINSGEISDTIAGRLYKMDIDPGELVMDIEKEEKA